MANFYVRVPFYVAAYYRTKDSREKLAPNEPIIIEETNPIWPLFISSLHRKCELTPSKSFCFCQKQWNTMMNGKPLSGGTILSDREDELTLSDFEVSILTGIKTPKNDGLGEYLCFSLPKEVFRDGKLLKVDAWWCLTNGGTYDFRKYLINEFWRALFSYMDRRRDACAFEKRTFIVIDCLDSFMERHDIHCSLDYHERETLKRGMNRKRKEFKYLKEDYIEHGI